MTEFGLCMLQYSPSGSMGGGGFAYSGFQVTGDRDDQIKGFLGFEIFNFGVSLGRKTLARIVLDSLI